MSLLGIAGLGVLVIYCHFWHNLVHLEKALFDSDCYSTVYDVGSKLCSCISTYLPPESTCRPSYNYRPPQCQRSQRSRSSEIFNSCRHCPEDERRNKSGVYNRRVNTGIFETSITGPTVLATAVRTLVTQTKNQHRIPNRQHQHLHHQAFIRHGATALASCSPPKYTIDPPLSIIHGCESDVDVGQNLLTT